jgi:hypothetical protein
MKLEDQLSRRLEKQRPRGVFGAKMNSPFFEVASVLVCLDHVASFIANTTHSGDFGS